MATGAYHRPGHSRGGKALAESLDAARLARRAQPRAIPGFVQVLVETRRSISPESLINLEDRLALGRNHAAVFRKDGQHSALVTPRAVVIAKSQLPAALQRDRAVPAICPIGILEIGIEGPIGPDHSRYD